MAQRPYRQRRQYQTPTAWELKYIQNLEDRLGSEWFVLFEQTRTVQSDK